MTLYAPPTLNGLQKTLDAQLDEGVTDLMTLNNVTGVQNKPGVVVINRIDSSGNELPSSVREWVVYSGTSGSTLPGLTRALGGSTDQEHAIGSVVEFVPDITVFQAIYNALTFASTDVFLDEDNMASNSAVKSVTQQSVKAYVDSGTATLTNKSIDGDDNTLTDLPAANLKIASQAQGDILYHNGSAWARLGAGTSGHFLKTQGTGANPTWAAQSSSGVTRRQAEGTTADPTTTSSTFSDIAEMTLTFTPASGTKNVLLMFSSAFSNTAATNNFFRFAKAGSLVGKEITFDSHDTASFKTAVSFQTLIDGDGAEATYTVQWKCSSGTLSAQSANRTFTVLEFS